MTQMMKEAQRGKKRASWPLSRRKAKWPAKGECDGSKSNMELMMMMMMMMMMINIKVGILKLLYEKRDIGSRIKS